MFKNQQFISMKKKMGKSQFIFQENIYKILKIISLISDTSTFPCKKSES